MRVLVCGGRYFTDQEFLFDVLDDLHYQNRITFIIEGGAIGADALSKKWVKFWNYTAEEKDPLICIEEYQANWDLYGLSAGLIRNKEMLVQGNPDLVVAFPGGKGTAHMVKISQKANVPVIQPVKSIFDEE